MIKVTYWQIITCYSNVQPILKINNFIQTKLQIFKFMKSSFGSLSYSRNKNLNFHWTMISATCTGVFMGHFMQLNSLGLAYHGQLHWSVPTLLANISNPQNKLSYAHWWSASSCSCVASRFTQDQLCRKTFVQCCTCLIFLLFKREFTASNIKICQDIHCLSVFK